MLVDVHNLQSAIPINTLDAVSWVEKFLTLKNIQCDEVAIYFVDKQEISRLHGEHFDDPTPTDCISFPMEPDPSEPVRYLGDVFVCPEVAKEYVETHGGDLNREIALYTIHGLLHLIGYDDIEESDRNIMRSQETLVLEQLFPT